MSLKTIIRSYKLLTLIVSIAAISGATFYWTSARATVDTTALPDAAAGQAYTYKIQASGGSQPYTFEKWYNTYPGTEMTLNADGTFSGTPTQAGTWELGVRVTDGTGLGVYKVLPWKATGTSTASIVRIDGIQGYNQNTQQYSNTVATPNMYVVLYGSFATTGNQLVSTGTVGGSIDFQSATQINVKLGDGTGIATFAIRNANGTSNSKSIGVGTALPATTLTVSMDPSLVTGTIPAGAPRYIFAAFKLQTGNAPVTISSVRVVTESGTPNQIKNIIVSKDGTALNSAVTILSNSDIAFSSALTIPANSTAVLEISAQTNEQATGQIRLGISSMQFTGATPTITPALPVYGPVVTIVAAQTPAQPAGQLSVNTSPIACAATTAQVTITVTGTTGTTYTVKRNNENFITTTGNGSTSDTISLGATNTYTLFANNQQIGTAQTVTGARQTGCTTTPSAQTDRYVRVAGDPTVYWVTSWNAKMPILSAEVFYSYGSKWEQVQIISQEALDALDDVDYIKLKGNARVYKIEGAVKRYLTPAAAQRLAIDPAKVVTVNETEFYSYRTGKMIQ